MRLADISAGDIFENGRYVAYKLSSRSKEKLLAFVEPLDIPGRLESDSWHITLISSRKDFPWVPEGNMSSYIRLDKKTFFWDYFARTLPNGTPDKTGSLVLRCKNGYLDHRFAAAVKAGAEPDFPEYKQHISMSYTFPVERLYDELPTPDFHIDLVSEYQTPLRTDDD